MIVDATAPPEVRGLARDEVRLLTVTGDGVSEGPFRDLPDHLTAGDLLIVNTSTTLAAAVEGAGVVVHFSTALDDGSWVAELRPTGVATGPLTGVKAGHVFELPGASLTVIDTLPGQTRLHRVRTSVDPRELMWDHGNPIRYAYVTEPWPLADYQTVFARDAGSAEMPSAARPFTTELVTELVTRGILVAPVTLHTGVSSAEPGEPPQPERFRVPGTTARLVNHVRAEGARVVAVGTSVTRALETVADEAGVAHGGQGWTDLVLGPDRPARLVRGLVTGWHATGASHLDLLTAIAGPELVATAYDEAARRGLRRHEFGDSCLLLP